MKHEVEPLTPDGLTVNTLVFWTNGYESLLVAEFCEFVEVKKEKLFCPYSG